MEQQTLSEKEKIHNFFEEPKGFWAWAVQVFIFVLIILSVYLFVLEFFYKESYEAHFLLYSRLNYFILAIFTIEYMLRFFTSPKKSKFFVKPMNMVDFFAVFPNYIELFLHLAIDTRELRILRLIRILRFTRMFRVFRLFRYGDTLKKTFNYKNTILQSITPVVVVFGLLKGAIWALERYGFWISDSGLGELFAIIGFALGIILSQKIGVSYGKFIQVEEAVVRVASSLASMRYILNSATEGAGSVAVKKWSATFLNILEDHNAANVQIEQANFELYKEVIKAEEKPADVMVLYMNICQDAALALSKKLRLTPKAYDTLLQQATMLYLALITAFIPGFTGLISVLVACYILYGMYHLTEDIDSVLGGDYTLINIDISELKHIAKD